MTRLGGVVRRHTRQHAARHWLRQHQGFAVQFALPPVVVEPAVQAAAVRSSAKRAVVAERTRTRTSLRH
eukprot:5235346-Amphidinium_carterae.1